MKIECEHCGAFIDVTRDKKCKNCGAPYNKNKEYLKKLEEGGPTGDRPTPKDKLEDLQIVFYIIMLILLIIANFLFR